MQVEQKIEVILSLTPEEVQWLHGVMQNPLHGQSPQEEDIADRTMRRAFFNATDLR
ncbi:hypothetical protein [Vreelandella venusta]|uniref:hypothetical protein n=1 Tax=Vreelandella venusta TaxID=44935 RepID=UPI00116D97CD|nr:hypothetical protein [Halomonas venusta]GEK52376.1 hypothetical protein HVE01_30970 [Halomonas venusta]